jgi:hypothetical protein
MLPAQAPTHRPLWMLVLAGTMLLYGGVTLVGGLLMLRDPRIVARQPIGNVARTPSAEESVRKLEPILHAIVDRHRTALRGYGAASIVFGLFTLYAVAAVLSRDRNGRRLALTMATLGIVYQLAELPLSMRIAKETVAAAGPLLADIMAAGGEGAGRTQAELVARLDAAASWSPLLAAGVIGWCLLLLVYFGGRHGREIYGLGRTPQRVRSE